MERIKVENLSKKFKIGFLKRQGFLFRLRSLFLNRESKKEFLALNNISFNVNQGEIFGIIGKNASGKSTLLRIISGIYEGDEGQVFTNGKLISLIGLGSGLKPRMTLKDNVYLCCSLFGLSQKEINEKYDLIIKFSELEEYVDTKLYQFSSGMFLRLAFSIAIYCNPEILILDEVFSVGDENFRKKSTKKLLDLVKKGTCILMASHNLILVSEYCKRAIVLDKGKILFEGSGKHCVKKYLEMS